ncbi:hypothetical protein MANES_06G065450v8 [Manihot esculenta]|uniref:Uncharacterized protein n=1 Tax=Manihot esculenta TaxID=3983 RepID=A0ACB7HK92_MANES|nr:hypothetical protein MANES_06G065450v8 [Manihot esculenta]
MVVGFEMVPCNFMHNAQSVKNTKMYEKHPSLIKCDPTTVSTPIKESEPIVFTYEVTFEESDIKGALILEHEFSNGYHLPCWYCPCHFLENCEAGSDPL